MYYVLYADSDERSRQMACGYRFWQESGFCLKAETGSGEEALNLLKKDYFDLVITDGGRRHPAGGGYEAAGLYGIAGPFRKSLQF